MKHDYPKAYAKSKKSFKWFLQNVFWKSYKDIKPTPHLDKWAELMINKNVALLSARRHLKSTLMYAFVMWKILINPKSNQEILYISLKEDLARYHIRNIKRLIQINPYFVDYKDTSSAESEIKGYWFEGFMHTIEPSGMESLKRGRRADIIICDDILADPTIQLEPVKIEKANRIFFEEIMSIPREGGEVKVVGTAQHISDLFFKLKDNKSFAWSYNPAILNELTKEVLWQELFPYERLIYLRDVELGERAFRKEYMCSPVWSEDAYFKREMINRIIDKNLINYKKTEGKPSNVKIVAGLDIGKHTHPSHFAVFEVRDNVYKQIYQLFMDNWEYTKQVDLINNLAELFLIDQIRFDNTRGELESFMESGICHRSLWKPISFTAKEKSSLATNFEKVVLEGRIRIQNDQRMINSILSVNNDLDALETNEGHGDAFWSISLALGCKISKSLEVAGAGRY